MVFLMLVNEENVVLGNAIAIQIFGFPNPTPKPHQSSPSLLL